MTKCKADSTHCHSSDVPTVGTMLFTLNARHQSYKKHTKWDQMVVLLVQTTLATTKLIGLSIFKTKINALVFNYPIIKETLEL